MTLRGILWFVGFIFVFMGEQILGVGVARWVLTGLGAAIVIASLGWRIRDLSTDDASRRDAVLKGLIAASAGAACLLTHALATDDVTGLMGLVGDARARWQGVLGVLTPVLFVVGALPMVFVDQVLAANPISLPDGAPSKALVAGLYAGLAIALVFPVNYLASQFLDDEIETAYFRTTRLSVATRAAVQNLADPLTVYAFFPPGNDVLEEVRPYLEGVASAGGDQVRLEVHDQATSVALAEELKLTDNGWIVLQQGEDGAVAKFKMRLEKDRAKRDLRRFDQLFHKNLLKATRGRRTAYFVTGHGEATQRVRDNDWRKISDLRKELQDQSYDLEDLGLVEGLADEVPDDADLVVIAAPTNPLLDAEAESLVRWVKDGGELLVFLDARGDDLANVLGPLGLERVPGAVVDVQRRVPGQSPYLLVTNRYGTHASVKELSAARAPIPFAGGVAIREAGQVEAKRTVLLRTFGTAFVDENLNGRQDESEAAKVYNLGYAVEGGEGEGEWRAVVLGNVGNVSNAATRQGWRTGIALALDTVRWLAGEEELIGGTESEEDVTIDVTSGAQVWLFWSTIFLLPGLVLAGGTTWVLMRRRRQR